MSGNASTVMTGPREKKRVLFVCTENRMRSLTAHQIYRGRPDLEVQSAGVSEYARVPLTQAMFEWADQVFVFSKRQQRIVEARFGDRSEGKRLVCLHLPDRFQFDRPKLVSKLTGKLGPYLGPPANDERFTAAKAPARSFGGMPACPRNPDRASLLASILSMVGSAFSGAKTIQAEPSV